ncbi:helix-turn-helix domain-containing protein [Roseivivax sp. THAF197b]|uniref:helix-turn-helix domain-containing protein n=1 Tax=Roseivivax sp. THAF197b TaxID=2588299 RepID=UPI00126915DE|nr:helix-turn-helix domain-containing protein [Roseivivax sp. THAF197b]QFS83402.1 cytoskeletal protein RodZ [Roseivivax sp. THAF197b]
MIGRKSRQPDEDAVVGPQGYDTYEVRLGDVMRGERATMGKSLLDVEREIRIKANYIAAIENCDPTAFDTPGFIAGYVRSYSRYLNLDPDEAFAQFCAESGFETAHGMSEAASIVKRKDPIVASPARDPFADPRISFAPAGDGFFSRVEPGAIGSTLVLLALVTGIGYGGYSVLQEVQRVRLAPVDQTPVVLTDLDPVDVATAEPDETADAGAGPFTPPSPEALDRLYRPEALDVPVLIARDAPISTLDPSSVGAFADAGSRRLPDRPGTEAPRDFDGFAATLPGADPTGVNTALAQALGQDAPTTPQVLEAAGPGVTMLAVRPAWVRVRAADGSVIFEGIMNAGDTYDVPRTEEPPSLRIGESGAVYFAMNGQTYGPVGPRGSVTSNLALSVDNLSETYSVAELQQDADLARVVAELNVGTAPAATE